MEGGSGHQANHADRVGSYAVEIYERWARMHEVPEYEIARYKTELKESASYHDIGKLGVPREILDKPGKLSPGEYEVIKRHVLIGACYLENAGIEGLARDIALNHHERWDGAGYPGARNSACVEGPVFGPGKKGREIPLAARIVALADVYDALVSERPYKKPWAEERALRHIRRESGRHFDPEIVTAFCEVFESIKALNR